MVQWDMMRVVEVFAVDAEFRLGAVFVVGSFSIIFLTRADTAIASFSSERLST